MILICGAIVLLSMLAVGHTYLIYPWLTLRQDRGAAATDTPVPASPGDWPPVEVLMSVYNEAAVLPAKLASLSELRYPGELSFRITSDCSTDGSNELLRRFAERQPCTLTLLDRRGGKPAAMNRMAASAAEDSILILTDANVLLQPATVRELVLPLANDRRIGLTDSAMRHVGVPVAGVGMLEDRYIAGEVRLKVAEGQRFRHIIGPFGGCWAIRAEAYLQVPATFLVDDFFLCMAAYERGWEGLTVPRAVALEGVGTRLADEFRRKRRIGAGNWQNMVRFSGLWLPPWKSGLAYAFFSHKVLRWLTPHFLLFAGVACIVLLLSVGNYWFALLFVLTAAVLVGVVPALRYFAAMNLALFMGWIDYLNGITTNVWQPSDRNTDFHE